MKFKCYTFLLMLSIPVAHLQGQDYMINFSGSGASTSVTTVIVENLTQDTKLTMSGNDALHLEGILTGIEPNRDGKKNGISFSPNPMTDYSQMRFVLPEPGKTEINLIDLSGRKLLETRDLLSKGQNNYRIQGLDKGIYIVSINSGKYSTSGKLVCSGSANNGAKITFENTASIQEKKILSKGTSSESEMQYNDGDRLKLTGISGKYSTIITDIITGSKTITYNFIACTDAAENNYSTVQIGTQTWMGENLCTTVYNDGTPIPAVNDTTIKSPGYTQYPLAPLVPYGLLYNWFTVKTGKLCPTGWHVPTDFEWLTLAVYLGGENVTGGKLKEMYTSHWITPNYGATNETGFTAVPGGFYDGSYRTLGYAGYWWSSTEIPGGSYAYYRALYNESAGVIKIYYMLRYNCFSIRCLKDD